MGQKITINIIGRKFPLVAESPEQEKTIREAAEKVDEKYYEYLNMNPGKTPEQILSFVALNGFIRIAELEKAFEKQKRGEDDLRARLRGYLEDIEKKNSR